MSLTIRKTAQGEFEHITPTGTIIDGNPNVTFLGDLGTYKTRNGAVIVLNQPATTTTVIDVATSSNETFGSALDLITRLRALGYFNLGSGTLTGNNTLLGLSDTAFSGLNTNDLIQFNGTVWVNVPLPNAFGVSSWNGETGDVNVNTDQLPEGTTNQYFTDARVDANANVQANTTHRDRQDNPHNLTKDQVGLSNVDNTSDLAKPISTVQETRFQEIENETAIVVNGNFATVANVAADALLNQIIVNNPNRPLAVFNEDGRIYTYDWTNGNWEESETDLSGVQLLSDKGIANGYVPLNASSLIDAIYLPSYVDDVLEFADFASFPITGESGKIYVAVDSGFTYRWSGSSYIEIGGGGASVSSTTINVANTAFYQPPDLANGTTVTILSQSQDIFIDFTNITIPDGETKSFNIILSGTFTATIGEGQFYDPSGIIVNELDIVLSGNIRTLKFIVSRTGATQRIDLIDGDLSSGGSSVTVVSSDASNSIISGTDGGAFLNISSLAIETSGTWTPTISASGMTYNVVTESGTWTKLGDKVTATFFLNDVTNGAASSSPTLIGGFPFNFANDGRLFFGKLASLVNSNHDNDNLSWLGQGGQDNILLFLPNISPASGVTLDFSSAGDVVATIEYYTN